MGKYLSIFVATIVLVAAGAYGQQAARVTGSVVDASGAAVPGAAISLQLPGSGTSVYSTVSSAAGDYTLLTVSPGTYDLSVDAKGFLKSLLKGVKVDSNRVTDIPAIKVDLAGVSQTVEIADSTATVETSSVAISTTISRSQIQSLPILNRSPLGFLQTQAGINSGRGSTTVNGLRSTYVNVTLDGINIQDNFIRTNDVDFLPNLLLLDQVAEVTVTSSNATAAAQGGGAQVQFASPSGGNQFHGSVYWTNRNNALAANTWFNNQAGIKGPFLNQNQVGATLGGPVIKNKLFFYSNYEVFRLRQQTTQNATILLPDARNGIVTYLDTTTREAKKANVLSLMGLKADPAITSLVNLLPTTGNNSNLGDSRNTTGYTFAKRNNRTRDNVLIKGDYLPSTKHSFTVNHSWNRDQLDRPDQDTTFNVAPSVQNDNTIRLLSSSWRYNPNPHLTNEVRFGFNWAPAIFLASQDIPKFFITGLNFTNPINTFRTQGRNTDTWNLADNANYVTGRHTLSFGYQMQKTAIEVYNDAAITPTLTLGIGTNTGLTSAQLPGISASDLGVANGILTTLGGLRSSASQTFNVSSRTSGYVNNYTNLRHLTFDNYALYVQDAFKVNRRLTVNAGVRWDYYTPVDERDGLALLPVLKNNNVIQTMLDPNGILDFAGNAAGRPYYKKDRNNFAPNLGIAFDPTGQGKWSIRAGYALFFVNDNSVQTANNSAGTNAGLSSGVSLVGLSGQVSTVGAPVIPTPAYKVPRTFADNYALNTGNAQGIPDPGLVTPYVQQWNLSVQRSIKNTVVDVRYIGNHATKSVRGFDYNQVIISEMLPDFLKAQNNGLLALKAGLGYLPAYNANIAGSQPLPFFGRLTNSGSLTNATVVSNIQTGQVGELGNYYQTLRQNGTVNFFANPSLLGANVLSNYSNSTYNALQIDVNRRFANGFQGQINYVFSKVMGDAQGDQQTNFEPFLDINNAKIEKSRAAGSDITHVIKANGLYELPFGKGQKFQSGHTVVNKLIGGWRVSGIMTRQSGTPFSILSGRGTFNRAGRSGSMTANTALNKEALDALFRLEFLGSGPFFVPQGIKGADGRAVAGDGLAPFSGQVFTQPTAGTIGTLQKNYFSGPWVLALDSGLSKTTKIGERHSLEFRMTATNAMNHPTFFVGDQTITSNTFGKVTSTFFGRRVVQFELYYRF